MSETGNKCEVCGAESEGKNYSVYYGKQIRKNDYRFDRNKVYQQTMHLPGSCISSYYYIAGKLEAFICNLCFEREKREHLNPINFKLYKMVSVISVAGIGFGLLIKNYADSIVFLGWLLIIISVLFAALMLFGFWSEISDNRYKSRTLGSNMAKQLKREEIKDWEITFNPLEYKGLKKISAKKVIELMNNE